MPGLTKIKIDKKNINRRRNNSQSGGIIAILLIFLAMLITVGAVVAYLKLSGKNETNNSNQKLSELAGELDKLKVSQQSVSDQLSDLSVINQPHDAQDLTDKPAKPAETSATNNITGTIGPRGPVGPQGLQGETGPQGLQGASGEAGPQGDPGVQGPQGLQGLQGPAGPQGIQGIQGTQGPQGIQGPQGAQGPQGPSGVASCPYGDCLSLQAGPSTTAETGYINITGNVTANSFVGNGSQLTNLEAGDISSGTLSDDRLSSNIAKLSGSTTQTFTNKNKFTDQMIIQPAIDSSSAFAIQNAAGDNILLADTSNSTIVPGSNASLDITQRTFANIDSGSQIYSNSLAIATDGNPMGVYLKAGEGYKFYHCSDTTCQGSISKTVLDVPGTINSNMYRYSAITLGEDNLPVLVYVLDDDLVFAKCSNTNCSTKTTHIISSSIGTNSGSIKAGFPVVQNGDDGKPIVVFSKYDGVNYEIRAVKCGNNECNSGNTDSMIYSSTKELSGVSITIDKLSKPAIAFAIKSSAYSTFVFLIRCGNQSCSAGNTSMWAHNYSSSIVYTGTAVSTRPDNTIDVVGHAGRYFFANCDSSSCTSVTPAFLSNGIALVNPIDNLSFVVSGWSTLLRLTKCTSSNCSSYDNSDISTGGGQVQLGTIMMVLNQNGFPAASYATDTGQLSFLNCTDHNCSDQQSSQLTGGITLGSASQSFRSLYVDTINAGRVGANITLDHLGNFYLKGMSIDASGAATFANTANSTAGFQIQNSTGTALFLADTTNMKITLGAPSATPILLVLGNKNTTGDPTGEDGATYYNSNTNRFRCYENGAWHDCSNGTLGYAQVVADQTGITTETDLTGLTTTVTVPANRRIRITGLVALQPDSANTPVMLKIKDGTTQIAACRAVLTITTASQTINCPVTVKPSAGSKTYKLTLTADNTTSLKADSTTPSWILVEDIGQ